MLHFINFVFIIKLIFIYYYNVIIDNKNAIKYLKKKI